MLRFAPSPTGEMHIGDLRIALLNYIVSKQKKEDLIVRIEDIDKEKNIEGKDKEILDILNLFGIEYTQTIYQSENVRFHTAMALQLIHEKKAFSCFCSNQWLDNKREGAKNNQQPYLYDNACANLPAELVIDNLSPFTIRVNKPSEDIIIKDHVSGTMTFKTQNLDSFVIMNQDKTPTYNFACAVDDMLSDISIVIRSDEYFKDTPKQNHIRTALKYDKKIQYAHLPMMIDDDSTSVKWLLEEGFLPEAISNYLISIGNELPKKIFTLSESIQWLDLEKSSKSPTRFDINALRDINRKHLLTLDAKELSRYVGFADAEIGELAKVYLQEVSTTKELRSKIEPIFSTKEIAIELSETTKLLISTIKDAPHFEEYNDFEKYIMTKSKLEGEEFFTSLRYILTGTNNGPDISGLYKYLKNYIGEIVK